jgi:competence protein ComEC
MVWAFDQEGTVNNTGKASEPVYGKTAPDLPRLDQHKSQVRIWLARIWLAQIWLAERWQEALAQNTERLVLWLPVGFAFGAGLTCSLRANDKALVWVIATFGLLLMWLMTLVLAQRIINQKWAWMCTGLAALALIGAAFSGGGAAGLLRAQAVAEPVIADAKGARALTGYVEQVDKSQRGAWRALIRVTSIAGVAASDRPALVRISLQQDEPPLPGTAISCTAILRPPPGPVVPGAYDHSRRAWFQRLGGVGFALAPCAKADLGTLPSAMTFKLLVSQWRAKASRAIVEAAPGPGAGFLAAIATGDRAWLSPEDTQALQISGLSHIISVSGLHVSLLGGMVFLAIWKMLALVPAIALRVDARKIGAGIALILTGAYTVFSGAEAPAVRAFIMSGIAFGAVILDRKAISMRGLALAAIAVLMVLPESALEPGFQMSFLATAALVAMWEVWDRQVGGETNRGPVRTVLLWVGAAAGTSFIAGLATAPVSAATFHRLSPWALPANLLAAPINDFIVAPTAVIGAALSPFGLGEVFWKIAGWGLSINLKIAYFISSLPGAATTVAWTAGVAPIIMIFAILWMTLWRSWLRYMGIAPFLIGVTIWIISPKPVGWIGPEAKAVLATPHQSSPQLCRTSGGRFDAARLMDHAGLSDAQADRLMPPSQIRLQRACFAGEGDWKARYVEVGRGRAVLSLTLDGKTHAFGRGDIPDGALIMRDGWRVFLANHPPRQGPWAASQIAKPTDLDGSDALRIGHEQ